MHTSYEILSATSRTARTLISKGTQIVFVSTLGELHVAFSCLQISQFSDSFTAIPNSRYPLTIFIELLHTLTFVHSSLSFKPVHLRSPLPREIAFAGLKGHVRIRRMSILILLASKRNCVVTPTTLSAVAVLVVSAAAFRVTAAAGCLLFSKGMATAELPLTANNCGMV